MDRRDLISCQGTCYFAVDPALGKVWMYDTLLEVFKRLNYGGTVEAEFKLSIKLRKFIVAGEFKAAVLLSEYVSYCQL